MVEVGWVGCIGRVLIDHRNTEPQNDWVGRVLKDHGTTEWLGWDGMGGLEGSLKIPELPNGFDGLGQVG